MRMYCRHCHEGQEIAWHERRPVQCPVCHLLTPLHSDWLQSNAPTVAWTLSPKDERLLRILRIAHE